MKKILSILLTLAMVLAWYLPSLQQTNRPSL